MIYVQAVYWGAHALCFAWATPKYAERAIHSGTKQGKIHGTYTSPIEANKCRNSCR